MRLARGKPPVATLRLSAQRDGEHVVGERPLHDSERELGLIASEVVLREQVRPVAAHVVLEALGELPTEQQECLIMRFLQGMSIAETAAALGRSDGAIKQLQLRGVRNLAKLMPEGLR